MPETAPAAVTDFITRWGPSGGRERANYQMFLAELCDLLDVPRPDPALAEDIANAYVFDRSIPHHKSDGSATTHFIDLYKAGHFVLETKQGVEAEKSADPTGSSLTPNPVGHRPLKSGSKTASGHGKRGTSGYDKAMVKAHAQAEGYIHDLPAGEGRPPFLIVCDVGYVFELYAEFTQSGGRYQRFPTPKAHRIYLDDLADEETRELLRTIWTDPHSLDPSKRIARVTRDIADRLARLAKSLEAEKHDPGVVATFLQRCLFTMFAEDIGLLPEDGFLNLLQKVDENPASFPVLVTGLWKEMATGTDYSPLLLQKIAYFNGGLFENANALPLTREQVNLLIDAAEADWKEVDPAIFGTLLERALDPRERHKLGAHYTPRSYVERLIEPTVIQPLREKWEAVKAAAVLLSENDQFDKARGEVERFHRHLCSIKILDPACGSGNFLYVTLEHIKQLEAEVLELFDELGGDRALEMDTFKVRPNQFLGIEVNANAARIAQLVIWIGFFQWHHKTTGKADTNDRPLLGKMNGIENRDAVLAYDEKIPRLDADGKVVEIWDGITTKKHSVTGKDVPDESRKKVLYDYTNPRRPDWPEADYVVGNPPFVGNKRMRDVLGDGYTEALRKAWKGDVPSSADFVMFWWQMSAELVRGGACKRFGLITTNSIHQALNRRVVEQNLKNPSNPISLAFAIPDHPWVDSGEGAAVRIAMTVGTIANSSGILGKSLDANKSEELEIEYKTGLISSGLTLGADLGAAISMKSNESLSGQGVIVLGSGFLLDAEEKAELISSNPENKKLIRPYLNGSDLVRISRGLEIIDLNDFSEDELKKFPEIYQRIYTLVRPTRLQMKDKQRRTKWWLFGRSNQVMRKSLEGLSRYIGTCRTAKHRIFTFISGNVLPDAKIVAIGNDDASILGLLSSIAHRCWSERIGVRMGVGNDLNYNHADCFNKFPFPDPDEATRSRIRDLGERLDAHRKRQQELHPDLTLTGIYNVLEKLRADEALTDKERKIHDDGLVSVLKQIHDDLDEAVFHAYGWDDLHSWYREAETGTIHMPEPESGSPDSVCITTTQLDASGEGLRESTKEAHEKYDEILLERLVALNHERAAEEAAGKIRWLRPEFQNPDGDPETTQAQLAIPAAKKKVAAKATKQKWPDRLTDQISTILALVPALGRDPETLSQPFGRKSTKREAQIEQVIEVLESLGKV